MTIHRILLFYSLSLLSTHSTAEELTETTITTATRTNVNTNHDLASISVLTNNALILINPAHIHEALQGVAGVSMHRGNGQESLNAIRSPVFTGAGACGAFLNLEDGIPLRAAGFCNVNELFEAHTEHAKQIEVIKGSASALYGANALHGMTNTLLPSIAPKTVGVELGNHGYSRLKTSWHWQQGKQTSSIFFTGTQDNGFRSTSGYDQQKLSIRYNNEWQTTLITAGLTASKLNQETAGFIQGINSYKNKATSKTNPTPEAYRDAESVRAWLKFDHEIDENQSMVITPYIRKTDMDFLQHFLPGDPLEQNGQWSLGIQNGHYYYFDNDDNHRLLITGIDLEFTDAYLRQSQDSATTGSAFLIETVPQGRHYDYTVKAQTIAPFITTDYALNEQWVINAGLRYEQNQYDYNNNMEDGRNRDDGTPCGFGGCRYSRPADSKDTFENTSTHLALSYQNQQSQTFYLKLLDTFRAPQATELYRLQRNQNKASLDSVKLKSIEFGLTGQHGTTEYAATLFHQQKHNVIFRDTDFFNVSNGKSTHSGLEVSLTTRFDSKLSVSINASYAKHQYDHYQVLNGININGNDIDTAPRLFGQARIQYDYQPESSLSLAAEHMGKYFLDPENLHQYDGHTILNLNWQHNLKANRIVSGHIENLLDKRYAARADFTSFTNERYFPGRPRGFRIGITQYF